MPLTDEELCELLDEWKEFWVPLLRLQDWNIHVKVQRGFAMSEHDVLAKCERCCDSKDAYISVLSTQDIHAHKEGDDADYEITFVHELLHIHFSYMDNTEDARRQQQEEIIVNTLSRTLVGMKRASLPS